ncbi:MAG: glycoside hydrolase family 20 zincin-like fold domain-containing protein [Victivallaceae bacterium]|nr:family 20 glycosylhydrolase [Victivallaceae bacterium]
MKKTISLIAAIWLGAGSVFGGNAKPELLNGRIDREGVFLACGPTVLSMQTKFVFVEPPWRQLYFYNAKSPAEFRASDDGKRWDMMQTGDDALIKLHEYSLTLNGSEATVKLRATLTANVPCEYEGDLMLIPDTLLAGASYTITLSDGKTVSGAISKTPPDGMAEIFSDARKMLFESRYGTLDIDITAGPAYKLVDRRSVFCENLACFWLGTRPEVKQGDFETSAVIKFTPNPDLPPLAEPLKTAAAPASQSAPLTVVRDVSRQWPLLPVPKEADFNGKTVDATALAMPAGLPPRLAAAFKRLFTAQLPLEIDAAGLPVAVKIDPANQDIPHTEGYLLDVSDTGIAVAARSERGAFYALQTLKALYLDGGFRQCHVRDWPDFDLRGIHTLVDSNSDIYMKSMVEDVLAPLKMNYILLECEYAKWDASKGCHQDWAASKEQLAAIVKNANDNYIEVIPFISTMGYCMWMFENGQNAELAENPAKPRSYNPSDPKVYEFMTKVLDEVEEIFGHQSKYLHVGHDELQIWKEFPYPVRPENIAKGVPRLYLDDVMFYHRYAEKHGLKIMLWHDVLATPDESPENGTGGAAAVRPMLPKDIIICDWRYAGTYNQYPDLEAFAAEGFPTIACSWYEPGNVENLARAAKKFGSMGLMSTTWNGFHGSRTALQNDFAQLSPYVRVACRGWNLEDAANNYRADEVLSLLLDHRHNRGGQQGVMLDISQAANISFSKNQTAFCGRDDGNLTALTAGKPVAVGRYMFQIPERNGAPAAVALNSPATPKFPDTAEVQLDLKCSRLDFLHAIPGKRLKSGAIAAVYTIVYDDGSKEEIPVKYDWNIAALSNSDFGYELSPSASLAVRGYEPESRLWVFSWPNPYPDKTISKIIMGKKEAGVIVFALTAERP